MSTFSSRNHTVATVPVGVEPVWNVRSDPDLLAGSTPLVDHITVSRTSAAAPSSE